MRAVIQRVKNASVAIDGQLYSSIDRGLLVLLGIKNTDTEKQADYLAAKCAGLRIFEDADEKMNLSVSDVGGDFLIVSNFTLYGNANHGKRPSFSEAGRPEMSKPLYDYFIEQIRKHGFSPKTGVFGADMQVQLLNDGPVTIFLDTDLMM